MEVESKNSALIKAIELYKVYNDKRIKVEALKNVTLTIKRVNLLVY